MPYPRLLIVAEVRRASGLAFGRALAVRPPGGADPDNARRSGPGEL